jgi:small-conductance mechanosensitive channel
MTFINYLLDNERFRIIVTSVLFVISLFIIYIVYRFALKAIRKRASKIDSHVDNFIIDIFRVPILWLLFWIDFSVFTPFSFIVETKFYAALTVFNRILLILSIGWVLIKVVRALFYYLQNRLNINTVDNLNARRNLTKIKVFEGLFVALISFLTITACLMSFKEVRSIGISLLTSAGIAGIVIGFAAQKTIATFIAGIQIAITQPIRLDDVVIVEGEWGRIEEITLTYVVVKIWDERKLVVPVNYFIDNPFQNWTKNSSNILGTVFLYADYSVPVEALRTQLDIFLNGNLNWDKRVANIQVTDTKERYMELRILISSTDSSKNWDLRVDIREKMIKYLNDYYPSCFVRTRIDQV